MSRVARLLVKEAADSLSGEFIIPNSKYHAHRALILASLAPGTSRIHGLSDAGHVRYTIQALRRLGTSIELDGDTFVVAGGPYRPTRRDVSVGSSGTTLYFMTGLASLAESPVTIVGQKYFQRRPIGPLLDALEGLGVVAHAASGCPPIEVEPRRPRGGRVSIAGTLSQWISGLLLVAPFASGPSVIDVEGELNERSYIDLTIRMMAQFGLRVDETLAGRRFEIEGNQVARPTTLTLPPDVGAAAFGLAVTALHPSDVLFRGLRGLSASDTDHPEADFLDIVRAMGLPLSREVDSGLVRVRHDGVSLQPVDVDCRSVPDMLPILSVLANFAHGTTTLRHVAHVRLKESDRVAAMLQLNRMGARLEERGDHLLVRGPFELSGADVSSFNDHRVLMSLAVAGTRALGETRLTYPNAYRISYPRFLDEMNGVGLSMSVESVAAGALRPPDSRRHGTIGSPSRVATTPLALRVRRLALERPDEPAVLEGGSNDEAARSLTWRELDERADALATTLLTLDVSPGDVVAYQLPNCLEFVITTLAVLRVGAICCPLMPIFREREMAYALRTSRARVLVVVDHFRGRHHVEELETVFREATDTLALTDVLVVGEARELGALRVHDFVTASAGAIDRDRLNERGNDPRAIAQLLFTSGTSGEPKGVLHRMDVLSRAAAMEVRHLGLSERDRVFIPSPLAHQTGFLYGMWLAIVLGVPQILEPIWDGRRALALVREHGATFVQAATPFLGDLVAAVEETNEAPDSLRIFVATGTAVPRGLAERATRTLGAAVCGAWGSTESCLGTLAGPEDEPSKTWGTDGRALVGVRVRVVDDAGRTLAPGEEGNFEVKSGCLFEGYLDHPEWTAAAMTSDGWYRSGDLAVIDEGGYLRLSGRVRDVINRGGEKVPVSEIEQLLHRHPAVRDVAVVAMPDERLGERACAYVVGESTLTLEDVRRYLEDHHVARPYWPERVEMIAALPRNATGKVQKYLLRERIRQTIENE